MDVLIADYQGIVFAHLRGFYEPMEVEERIGGLVVLYCKPRQPRYLLPSELWGRELVFGNTAFFDDAIFGLFIHPGRWHGKSRPCV